jgi:hypothetical protein
MYKIEEAYKSYYEDYVAREGREFRLKCSIGTSTNQIDQKHISSVRIEQDLVSGAEDYIVGNLGVSKLIITFDNSVVVKEGDKIAVSVELKTILNTGQTYWVNVPLGSFFVFEISKTALTQKVEAYDALYQKKLEEKYISSLVYLTTTHLILEELCSTLGISYPSDMPNLVVNRPEVVNDLKLNDDGKYEVVETDSNQVGFGLTVGAMLSYMASYLSGNFILEGNNKLKLINLYTSDVHKSYTLKDYAVPTIGDASYNIRCIKCTISTGEILTYGQGEDTQTMELENPFFDDYRTAALAGIINNINYKPVAVRIKGDPAIQLGDLIELKDVPHFGTIVFPVLKLKFSYTGGCGLEVESVCRTESEKSIKYKGTVSSRVDTLETTVSKTNTEIDKLNNSIRLLNSLKSSLNGMDLFIDKNNSTGILSATNLTQYELMLTEIERSRANFEEKYNLVYDHKYLQRT